MGPKRCQLSSESMNLAMEAVNDGTMNVTKASRIFQVPRQTLKDRVCGKFTKAGGGHATELTVEEENVLINYIKFMAKSSHPISVIQIKAFAWAIVKKSGRPSRFNEDNGPSWKWWRGFKKRHHAEITLRKPNNLDRGRSRMCNQNVMDAYFALYKELLENTGLMNKPAHIFNADESAVNLSARTGKVIVAAKAKQAYSEQKGPRDHLTTMVCCCRTSVATHDNL